MTNEAFSRVKIDAQLRDQGWEITNTNAVQVATVKARATFAALLARAFAAAFPQVQREAERSLE